MWTLAFVEHLDFFVDCCHQKRDRFFRHKNFLGIKPWSKHFGSKSSKWSKHREPRRRTWTTSTLRVQSWRLRMEVKVKAKVVQSFNFEENEKRFWSLMNQSFVLCVFWLAKWKNYDMLLGMFSLISIRWWSQLGLRLTGDIKTVTCEL